MAVVHILALLLGSITLSMLTVRAELGSSEAISCLTNAPAGDSTVSPRRYTQEEGYDVCIKYQTLSGNQWLWAYGATSSAKCAQMIQQSQQFKNVQCCMQSNCNAPDAVLNPNTRIVQPAQLTAAGHRNRRPQLTAKQRRILSHNSSKLSPRARNNLGNITCYRNVPTRLLQASQQSAVAPRTYMKTEMSELCARYTYRCAAGDRACSTDEIQTGVWKWIYAPLPVSICLELKEYSKAAEVLIKHVKCCSGSLCNRPDSTLDTTVAVLTSAPTAATAAAAVKHQTTVAAISRGGKRYKLTPVQTASGGRSSRLRASVSLPRASGQPPTAVNTPEMRSDSVIQ